MATYAIGDLQGCFASLSALLTRIDFGPGDRLWLVGDVVNRGPRSLATLRWIRDHRDRVDMVLGNHDLHLLAMAAGLRQPKKRDTAEEVLEARDASELVDFMRRRPFAIAGEEHLLVHAGVHPRWTDEDVLARAEELRLALARDDWHRSLAELHGAGDETRWREDLEGGERLQALAALFTRMRCVRPGETAGELLLDHRYDGPPKSAPPGLTPWFELDTRRRRTVLFGHWAALGYRRARRAIGLDTGCVWGNALTALRLEDGQVFHQPAVD